MGVKDQTLRYPAASYGKADFTLSGGQAQNYHSGWGNRTLVRTRTGEACPNWRTKVAAGISATTSLSAVWESGETSMGTCKLDYWGIQGNPNGYAGWDQMTAGDLRNMAGGNDRNPLGCATSPTFADNQARSKFYKALRKESVQWSAPTFLGELREALRMIRRPAQALFDGTYGYLASLAKEKRRNPRHWTRAVSGLYLEQAFGWTPLINDAKEAYQAYRRLVDGGTKKSVISGSFSHEVDASSTLPVRDKGGVNTFGVGFQRWRAPYAIRNEKIIVRYKAKVENKIESTAVSNLALFGFTFDELVPTAWELLPWSFLIDYFLNIGDVLNAYVTDDKNVAFVNRSEVRICRYAGYLTIDPAQSAADKSIWSTKAIPSQIVTPSWDFTRKDVLRSAVAKVNPPRLQFSFDLGNGQLANLAALLGAAISLHPQRDKRVYSFGRR